MSNLDKIGVINRALSRIGCLPIQSEAAPGPAGPGVIHTYDAVLDDLLSKYPWHFTKRFSALSRVAATSSGWRWGYTLPPGRLALPRGYYETSAADRPLTRFQIAETTVMTDTDTLYAEWQVRPDPAQWPGHFTELVTLALAAEYALEIREDQALRERLRRDVYGPPDFQGEGGQFKVSSDLDAQSAPSPQPAGGANPLTDIRDGYDPDDARYGWG